MSSQTLTTRAVIQAVDQLTGPLSKMERSVRNFSMSTQRSYNNIVGPVQTSLAKLGTMPIMGGGFAAALGVHHVAKDAAHFDKIARQTRAIAEIGEKRWNFQMDKALDIGGQYGIAPEEIVKGAKSWLELGNSIESYTENLKIAGKTSKITGITIAEQMTETSAIIKAFGLDPKNHEVFREFERAYLVGAKGMKGGAHAYGEAMKNFAPIAASMGLNVQQASGFVQALGGQFEAGEIGNALKMGFARLMSPTAKAQAALRASGIDTMQMWETDKKGLAGSGKSFAERLRGAGKVVSPELEARLDQVFRTTDTSKGGKTLVDNLTGVLTDAYGRKGKGKNAKAHLQGEDSKLVAAAIAQQIMMYQSKLNVPEFFRLMHAQAGNVPLIKELFGGHHIAKFQDLFRQGHHVAERIEHNTKFSEQRAYRSKFGLMWKEDVIDRRARIVLEGLSHQMERMSAAWQALWTGVGVKSLNADMAKVFKGTADFLGELRKADPEKVRMLAWGLGAMAALPIATFAGSAIAGSIAAVGGLGMSLVRGLAALQLYPVLAGAAARSFTKMGAAAKAAGWGATGGILGGMGRGAGLLAAVARFTAMGAAIGGIWYAIEHWKEVQQALTSFGNTDSGKAMVASFQKLGAEAKSFAVDIATVADGWLKIMGLKPEDGAASPAGFLQTMGEAAKFLSDRLTDVLTTLRHILNPDVKLPAWVEALRMAANLSGWVDSPSKTNPNEEFGLGDTVKKWLGMDAAPPSGSGLLGGLSGMAGRMSTLPEGFRPASNDDWGPAPFGSARLYGATEPDTSTMQQIDPTAITTPITSSQDAAAERIGSSVDTVGGKVDAVVAAINALGPVIGAAVASGVSSGARFGGPAVASPPSGGNATGIKR